MIQNPDITQFTKHYADLPMSAYRITVNLLNSPVNYDPSHLDSLLSRCVVNQATQGRGLVPSAEPYRIPLPLKQYWQSDLGLPLWQSTDFVPCGDNEVYSLFWARRSIRPELVRKGKGGGYINIRGSEGPDKEYLMPIPAHSAMRWRADFYGNADEVAKLLEFNIGAIGKKRAMGYGVIDSWEIESIPEFSFYDDTGRAMRPIPLAALKTPPMDLSFVPMGWTPPYWLSPAWLPCLGSGAKLL